MKNKNNLKFLLGIYILLLFLTLIITKYADFIILLLGIFVFVTLFSVFGYIKKIDSNTGAKILSIILSVANFYLFALFIYGVSNISNSEGMSQSVIGATYLGLSIVSLVIGLVYVLGSRSQDTLGTRSMHNKTMLLILVLILLAGYYNTLVNKIASHLSDPEICSATVEFNEASILFRNGTGNRCVYKIAANTKNIEYCALMNDKNPEPIKNPTANEDGCIFGVAIYTKDSNLCYKTKNSSVQEQEECSETINSIIELTKNKQ